MQQTTGNNPLNHDDSHNISSKKFCRFVTWLDCKIIIISTSYGIAEIGGILLFNWGKLMLLKIKSISFVIQPSVYNALDGQIQVISPNLKHCSWIYVVFLSMHMPVLFQVTSFIYLISSSLGYITCFTLPYQLKDHVICDGCGMPAEDENKISPSFEGPHFCIAGMFYQFCLCICFTTYSLFSSVCTW